jgi:hypothetical protein
MTIAESLIANTCVLSHRGADRGPQRVAYRGGWDKVRPRLIESTIAGSVALVIASPRLLYGKLRFGSFMPVSGMAESASGCFTNTALLPASLFRYITLVFGGRAPVGRPRGDGG